MLIAVFETGADRRPVSLWTCSSEITGHFTRLNTPQSRVLRPPLVLMAHGAVVTGMDGVGRSLISPPIPQVQTGLTRPLCEAMRLRGCEAAVLRCCEAARLRGPPEPEMAVGLQGRA